MIDNPKNVTLEPILEDRCISSSAEYINANQKRTSERIETKKQHRRCDWINLSIYQLHGWVCLVAAARGRVSVHRSRTGSAVGWIQVLRACARAKSHVRARVHHRLRVCIRACVHPRAIRNRVARCTDSTSSIGAPNAEGEEEEKDRIDSPVTQTRDRATTSLTSAFKQESPSACTRRCARKIIKLLQSGWVKRCRSNR